MSTTLIPSRRNGRHTGKYSEEILYDIACMEHWAQSHCVRTTMTQVEVDELIQRAKQNMRWGHVYVEADLTPAQIRVYHLHH